ncbi:MAG: ornithine carbamoyltransferase [Bacillota bacterium]
MTLKEIPWDLRGRDLLSLHDFRPGEISYILDFAHGLKEKQKKGVSYRPLEGKTIGMIFLKHSTRTRVSFEVGICQLGGYPLFLSGQDLQLGRGETIADTARVLSRYLDGIMIRTFRHQDVEELALHADIPIINGLTDLLHPCQVLADLMTIQEKKGNLTGLKLAYVGDGNNMAHSLMIGGAKMAMEVVVASPPGYKPQPGIVSWAQADAAETGGKVTVVDDPMVAAAQADIIYTDVWTSMGQEAEREERLKIFKPYQINRELLAQAKPGALVMHCLPAHRGEEITGEVLEGPQSVVFDEAENRLHAQKAVMALLL